MRDVRVAVHGARPGKAMPVDRGLVAILRRTPAPPQGGVVALHCPTCNAPLTVAEGATQVTCKYCQTASRLARPATRKAIAVDPACWMLFKGPSRKRADLQS